MSSPVAAHYSAIISTPTVTPVTGATSEGLNHRLEDLQKYESILAGIANTSADGKFKDELSTTEQWFKVLSEAERIAVLYSLLQYSTQEQVQFFSAVLQKMEPEDGVSAKPKSTKTGVRPLSLNTSSPNSPTVLVPKSTVNSRGSDILSLPKHTSGLASPLPRPDNTLPIPGQEKSWASAVSTPVVPMFQKSDSGNLGSKGPGLAAINTSTLNLLATSGLSNEAQLLAVQLVMGGILQPADISSTVMKQELARPSRPTGKGRKASNGDWRSPSRNKSPSSAQRNATRNSIPKSNGPKSSGVAVSGLDSISNESPQLKDFNPELLNDIAAWLRSLRLHKYTSCFEGMTWQEMVVMDDTMLEKKGVAALGARRRLLRTFDHVRHEMGMQSNTDSAALPALVVPSSAIPSSAGSSQRAVPRLSADSPVFMPTGRIPQCATSVLQPATVTTV